MRKLTRIGKGLGLLLLSVTWCALQTVVGAFLALCLFPTSRVQKYRGMIVVYHRFGGTFSLGTFAFISNGVHEPRKARGEMYGHYLQSLAYGPAFFFLVSLSQLYVRIPCVWRHRAERDLTTENIYWERDARRLAARAGE